MLLALALLVTPAQAADGALVFSGAVIGGAGGLVSGAVIGVGVGSALWSRRPYADEAVDCGTCMAGVWLGGPTGAALGAVGGAAAASRLLGRSPRPAVRAAGVAGAVGLGLQLTGLGFMLGPDALSEAGNSLLVKGAMVSLLAPAPAAGIAAGVTARPWVRQDGDGAMVGLSVAF